MELRMQPLNPWRTIWFHPRPTIRYLVANDPERHVLILMMQASLVQMCSVVEGGPWMLMDIFLNLALFLILEVCVLYGAGALFAWVGRWIGGTSTAAAVRTVLAWSTAPYVWWLVVIPVRILILNGLMLLDAVPVFAPMIELASLIGAELLLIVDMFLALWSLVIFVHGLSEVHRFSLMQACLTTLIVVFTVVTPLFVLIVVDLL